MLRTTGIALSVFVVLMAAMLVVLASLSDVRLAPGAVPGAQLYDLIRAVFAVGTLPGGTYDAVPLLGCHFAKEVSFTDARFVGLDRRAEGRNKGWISFRQSVFSGGSSWN